jgi:threonyl-tRNA synthetase
MPERFGLKYVSPEGTEETPVMLHRAVLGSIERFIAILLEHCGGNLPFWLAPVQVKILTITDAQEAYARSVHEQLLRAGIRSELDVRNEKLGFKIREAELQKIPYMIVTGDKEVSTATVAPRGRKGEKTSPLSVEDFIARLAAEHVPGGAP